MSQKILELNESERKWIDANLQVAQSAIKAFSPEHAGDITLEGLDAAFAAWLAQHDPQKENPNPMINAFGIRFGKYLADHLDLQWKVVKDEHGTEMAVHGSPGDVLIFPLNFVAKRYVGRATGFFVPIYAEMEREVEVARAAPLPKPWWKIWSKS